MFRTAALRLVLLFASGLAVTLVPGRQETQACSPAPHRGEYVGINAEEAIIFYDKESKTEHFIRRANFQTEASDFGFLVPTPTQPMLGETKATIFTTLDIATQPRHVPSGVTRKIKRTRTFDGAAQPAPKAAAAAPVVLDEATVAGYNAVVLKASDTEGLKKWLEEHQYDARPALMDWLKWYVDNGWIITAFKISSAANGRHERWAKAVRLSFETDTPFYPYREPEDLRAGPAKGPRVLRVFFLADARFEGTLGRDKTWAGKTVWANKLPKHTLSSVVSGFGLSKESAAQLESRDWFLTEFDDRSSPRPGTDEVYFKRAADQTTVERPVILVDNYEYVDEVPVLGQVGNGPDQVRVEYVAWGAAGVVALTAAGAFGVWRVLRRV